jgi:iron-sulfur cluster repair protein YtfE (RIC family)
MDVYELLVQDHQKARHLFEKLADSSEGAEKTRDGLFARLKQELELHTQIEEKYFYPALRDRKETKELVEEALEEHSNVKQLLQELDQTEDKTDDWAEQLAKLQKDVEHHVAEEETELFPLARQVLDQKEADQIAQAIQQEKAAAE